MDKYTDETVNAINNIGADVVTINDPLPSYRVLKDGWIIMSYYDGTIEAHKEIKFNDSSSLINQIAGRAQINGLEPFYTYSYTDLEDGVIFKDDIIKSNENAIYFLWLYLDNTTPNDA